MPEDLQNGSVNFVLFNFFGMKAKLLFYLFVFQIFYLTYRLSAQKTVGLDNWFNHEVVVATGQPFHYTWNDTLNSGFSRLGEIFVSKGAQLVSLAEKPDRKTLEKVDIYIIVDPDTTTENSHPNYIEPDDVKTICRWVRKGGVLLLMGNDGPNCEFTHFNTLATKFGFYFHPLTLNPVTGKNWEMGAETNLPGHPIFSGVNKIYMKEVAPISVAGMATPVLNDGDAVFIAETACGKGYVMAVGDPWLYNEYIDNRRLPRDFENLKAAGNLAGFLLEKSRE
jgi:unsaturated rhamnogalacturonyl hydrolase